MKAGMFGTEPWLIEIGNNVHITTDCLFVTHDGGTLILRGEVPDLELTAPIVIGNDVYIGVRTIILPGVRIGNRCIIGAGSVVARNIPDNSLAAGVPARVIKHIDEYLEKAKASSLHLGHLQGEDKARELKKLFNR
jgi:acetyltransferase-like isoleucine patch superfamily enzyme